MNLSVDPHCIFKFENNSTYSMNIHRVSSNVGEIPRPYPFEDNTIGQSHYFHEYQGRESASRALGIHHGAQADPRISPVATHFSLMEQSYSREDYRSPHREPDNGPAFPTWQVDHSYSHPHESGYSENWLQQEHSDHNLPKPILYPTSGILCPQTGLQFSGLASAPGLCSGPASPHIFNTEHLSQVIAEPYSLETRLFMTIQGQYFVYDLAQGSGQDPEVIIELLKLSSSERGNWMAAGAHFRRIGKPQAAINTMRAMLEVMFQHGYDDTKLVPVYLLLAGCEWDLAICARRTGDIPTYQCHHENAKMLLQRVFGSDAPTLRTPLPNALLSSRLEFSKARARPAPPRYPRAMAEKRSHKYDPLITACRGQRFNGRSSRDCGVPTRGLPKNMKRSKRPVQYSGGKKNRRR